MHKFNKNIFQVFLIFSAKNLQELFSLFILWKLHGIANSFCSFLLCYIVKNTIQTALKEFSIILA